MFGIGGFELALILLFAFLVFGPDKLPEIARTVGELIGRFQRAQEEMNEVVKGELLDDDSKKNKKKKSQSSSKRNTGAKPAPKSKKDKDADKLDPSVVTDAVDSAVASAKESAREQRVEESRATESFMERKARFERERAEREQIEANRAEMRAEAAKNAAEAAADAPKPMPTAAELYGSIPAVRKSPTAQDATDKAGE